MKRLLLLGGGHAHLFVLEAFARRRPDAEVLLVTPDVLTPYSGMLPGAIAGHYRYREACIDLRPLAQRAGVTVVSGRAVALDPDRRCVTLDSGETLEGDLFSIDTGATPHRPLATGLRSFAHPVKPVPALIAALQAATPDALAVIGAGAAGVEVALALRHRLPDRPVVLIERGPAPLPGSPAGLQQRVLAELSRQRVELIDTADIASADGHALGLADGRRIDSDFTVLCTGAAAPEWLQRSGLILDARGFVAVDSTLRSPSHPHVFAAGDVSTTVGNPRPRSGVFAVRAGPPLARNLLRALAGDTVQPWMPQRDALRLLACGRRHAIAARGAWSLQGDWVWHWKDSIDRAFVRRFDPVAHAPVTP